MYELLIKNGNIVDGTGAEGYRGDIAINGGKIVFVDSCCNDEAKAVIDAEGLIVAPGFIDFHSHSDIFLLTSPIGANLLKQGVTTEITGNCGVSILPLSVELLRQIQQYIPEEQYNELIKTPMDANEVIRYIAKRDLRTNVAFLVGHGIIRYEVLGFDSREPGEKELEKMKELVRAAMEAGAIGMSTGLIYPPGAYAKEYELVELCKVVAEYGGIYASHIRSESDFVIDAVSEAIRIGENAGLPVVISHHKIAGKHNWGQSIRTLKMIENANKRGMKIRCDQYPYNAGETSLVSAIPPVFAADGPAKLIEKLQDKSTRQKIKKLLADGGGGFENLIYNSGFDGILIVDALINKEYCGKTIAQIADELDRDPYDTLFDLLVENKLQIEAVYFMVDEEDIENIMAGEFTMVGSDSTFVNEYIPAIHPRYTGAFVKIMSKYVRDKKLVPLEEAIRKMTSMPADMAGLNNKGIIKVGYDADLVVLDYGNLKEYSDFMEPSAPNQGVKYVLVNGRISVKDDTDTGISAGRALRLN